MDEKGVFSSPRDFSLWNGEAQWFHGPGETGMELLVVVAEILVNQILQNLMVKEKLPCGQKAIWQPTKSRGQESPSVSAHHCFLLLRLTLEADAFLVFLACKACSEPGASCVPPTSWCLNPNHRGDAALCSWFRAAATHFQVYSVETVKGNLVVKKILFVLKGKHPLFLSNLYLKKIICFIKSPPCFLVSFAVIFLCTGTKWIMLTGSFFISWFLHTNSCLRQEYCI